MHPVMIARILSTRRRLRLQESWTPEQVHRHRDAALADLRAFALDRSPFYRQFHRGMERAPLSELPVLTKAALMDNFDRLTTDRALRLCDLVARLDGDAGSLRASPRGNRRRTERYWTAATSGSSGRRSVVPSDAGEWATVIASYARANEWAGVRPTFRHPVTMAVVSSTMPWHQSSRVAATVRSPLVRSHRLDAATPLPQVVARLNDLRPDVLVGYASVIRALAEEQIAGRLRIAPRAVNASSEVLTTGTRDRAVQAWQVMPFDVYAATETGGIAADCPRHTLHLFEDLIIPEVVDDDYRPVEPGRTGDRLLVTVLFSRTVPLVRYELTDRVTLSTRPCPCHLPFASLGSVEGRTDDVLVVAAPSGAVRLHPVVFHRVLDLIDAAGWQVRQTTSGLDVLVAGPGPGFSSSATREAINAALHAAGAPPTAVDVRTVLEIPAGAAGKRPLVVARQDQETE